MNLFYVFFFKFFFSRVSRVNTGGDEEELAHISAHALTPIARPDRRFIRF